MKRLTGILTVTIALAFALVGCDSTTAPTASTSGQTEGRSATQGTQNVLEITAVHEDDQHQFELSDDKIPSGWTTIKLDNQTEATHFAFLRKASQDFLDGMKNDFGTVSAQAFLDAASIPFQEEFNPYYEGEIKFGEFLANLGPRTPAWFQEHRPIGGPGLTSGAVTSATTQNLEPGTYFIECYVLNGEGVFHVSNGMLKKLVVTEESSGAIEPEPTMKVSISDDGLELVNPQGPSDIRPGQHTVAVTFEENETQSGSDLHLFRFDDGTTVEELNAWMDWPDVGSEGTYDTDEFGPALTSYHDDPGPQTWLGGVQDIRPPLPETAYFHVVLGPGTYAWVAEIPNPKSRGFLETFTVPFGQEVPQPAQ